MSVFSTRDRQEVLEAVARWSALTRPETIATCRVDIVATDPLDHGAALSLATARGCQELILTSAGLRAHAVERMRALIHRRRAEGTRVRCLFDLESTSPRALDVIRAQGHPDDVITLTPLALAILDRRSVHLLGGAPGQQWSLLNVADPALVAAALTYIDACESVERTASGRPLAAMTARQQGVLELLSTGASDKAIASELQISVRTLRADVRAAMKTLGVTTRFEAGCAYARLTQDAAPALEPAPTQETSPGQETAPPPRR